MAQLRTAWEFGGWWNEAKELLHGRGIRIKRFLADMRETGEIKWSYSAVRSYGQIGAEKWSEMAACGSIKRASERRGVSDFPAYPFWRREDMKPRTILWLAAPLLVACDAAAPTPQDALDTPRRYPSYGDGIAPLLARLPRDLGWNRLLQRGRGTRTRHRRGRGRPVAPLSSPSSRPQACRTGYRDQGRRRGFPTARTPARGIPCRASSAPDA